MMLVSIRLVIGEEETEVKGHSPLLAHHLATVIVN